MVKSEEKKWYVLVTKPKAEKQVGIRLTHLGIENYVPLHKKLRIWHDRKKRVETPLFNSYIFVHIENKHRNKVFEAGGILKYVSIAGKISVLPENEIERIQTLCDYYGEIEIEKENFKIGEEVEIISGHFSGMRGHIFTMDNKEKFRITFSELKYVATIEINKENIYKTL